MKTPLPEKIDLTHQGNMDTLNAVRRVNQIIDYLAELTEVVEGKQEDEKTEPYLPAMCMCGEVDTLNGAEVEVGGVCHSLRHPCYHDVEYVSLDRMSQQSRDNYFYNLGLDSKTTSLKETLLENIDKAMEGKAAPEFWREFDEGLEVAKAIINRLMP